MSDEPLSIEWFSDALCIWAYVGQIRLDEALRNFGSDIRVEARSVAVFGSTARKIGHGWKDRGGFDGYAEHVQEIGRRYEHVELHPQVWKRNVPAGSLPVHAFVKAAELAAEKDATAGDSGRPLAIELAWRLRLAFFRDARDIGRLDVQLDVATELGLAADPIRAALDNGRALAAVAEDHELAASQGVSGSPTYVIDGGRQKLYGNVGYRVIEANIAELLRDRGDKASWC